LDIGVKIEINSIFIAREAAYIEHIEETVVRFSVSPLGPDSVGGHIMAHYMPMPREINQLVGSLRICILPQVIPSLHLMVWTYK